MLALAGWSAWGPAAEAQRVTSAPPAEVHSASVAVSVREEEERMILGAWILGAIAAGMLAVSLAA